MLCDSLNIALLCKSLYIFPKTLDFSKYNHIDYRFPNSILPSKNSSPEMRIINSPAHWLSIVGHSPCSRRSARYGCSTYLFPTTLNTPMSIQAYVAECKDYLYQPTNPILAKAFYAQVWGWKFKLTSLTGKGETLRYTEDCMAMYAYPGEKLKRGKSGRRMRRHSANRWRGCWCICTLTLLRSRLRWIST